MPKKQDFNKFMSKQFGEPIKKRYTNITFLSEIEDNIIKNDLDYSFLILVLIWILFLI